MQITTHSFITVGTDHEPMQLHKDAMTPEQLSVIESISQRPGFDIACTHFPVERKRGAFAFVYMTKDDVVHIDRITPTGRITVETCSG